mmetsp:Transcript_23012/g.22355  ORF Transcript_23012/g.22355 Transcript_23012/m.22355 type:complete len:262 (-) Transcript_23012:733-1518(-)
MLLVFLIVFNGLALSLDLGFFIDGHLFFFLLFGLRLSLLMVGFMMTFLVTFLVLHLHIGLGFSLIFLFLGWSWLGLFGHNHAGQGLREVLNEELIEMLDIVVQLIREPLVGLPLDDLLLGWPRKRVQGGPPRLLLKLVLQVALGGQGHLAASPLLILGGDDLLLELVHTPLEPLDLLLLALQHLGVLLILLEEELVVLLEGLHHQMLLLQLLLLLLHLHLVLLQDARPRIPKSVVEVLILLIPIVDLHLVVVAIDLVHDFL